MTGKIDDLRIGTAPGEDGTVRFALFDGDKQIGEKILKQDELASMAAHLLNAARAAKRDVEQLPPDAGCMVIPSGMSLAKTTEGENVMVLWFGGGGIHFSINRDIAKQLLQGLIDTEDAAKKH